MPTLPAIKYGANVVTLSDCSVVTERKTTADSGKTKIEKVKVLQFSTLTERERVTFDASVSVDDLLTGAEVSEIIDTRNRYSVTIDAPSQSAPKSVTLGAWNDTEMVGLFGESKPRSVALGHVKSESKTEGRQVYAATTVYHRDRGVDFAYSVKIVTSADGATWKVYGTLLPEVADRPSD